MLWQEHYVGVVTFLMLYIRRYLMLDCPTASGPKFDRLVKVLTRVLSS